MPLLSYIVPSYNHASYLEKLLISLQSQTVPDIEVIVTDDESTDDSVQIAARFARQDSRFKILSGNNLGIVGNRNRGLSLATAKYVSFVDSDDEVPVNRTELVMQELNRSGGNLLFGDAEIIDRDGKCIERFSKLFPEPRSSSQFSANLWSSYCFVPSVSVVVDRDALVQSGGFWGPAVNTDYLKWIELGLILKVKKLDKVILGKWRMHGKNTSIPSASQWRQHYTDLRQGLEQVLKRCPEVALTLTDKQKLRRFSKCHFMAGLFMSAVGDRQAALGEFQSAAAFDGSVVNTMACLGSSKPLYPMGRIAVRAALRFKLGAYADYLIGEYSKG